MKRIALVFIFSFLFIGAKNMTDIQLEQINGEKFSFSKFENKPVLVVNIATRCGYTGQLEGIEKIYKDNKDKGLTVIGIPSNDFGGQTPEENGDVAKFCRLKYGATFPILKKSPVKGENKHPLIKYLISKTGSNEIAWNFEKFVINKKGEVKRFSSSVTPESKEFLKAVNEAL